MGLVLSILSLKIRFPVHCSVYFILEPTSSWKPYMSQESCDGSNMTVAEKQSRFETHNQKYNNIIIYIYVHSVIVIYKYNHILYKYIYIYGYSFIPPDLGVRRQPQPVALAQRSCQGAKSKGGMSGYDL